MREDNPEYTEYITTLVAWMKVLFQCVFIVCIGLCELCDCYFNLSSEFDVCYNFKAIFMAHMGIPIIAFHGVYYISIYILVSLARVCFVFVVKEVVSFWGARAINGHGM